MPTILALDPGTQETGWVMLSSDGTKVGQCGITQNGDVVTWLADRNIFGPQGDVVLAIEMIASYGMPVGREVFETCVMIGRFQQAWHTPAAVRLVYRRDVKVALCGTSKAKDPNVRQALIDLFPPTGGGATPQVGTKGKPGPLYGVGTHVWPALGVAVVTARQLGTLKVQTQGPLFDQQQPRPKRDFFLDGVTQ